MPHRPPVSVYIDAQCLGRCDSIRLLRSGHALFRTRAPVWMREIGPRPNLGIAKFDFAAAALGGIAATIIFHGRPVLIRGACKTVIGQSVLMLLRHVSDETPTPLWVEYVPPKSNIADAPARRRGDNNGVNFISENSKRPAAIRGL